VRICGISIGISAPFLLKAFVRSTTDERLVCRAPVVPIASVRDHARRIARPLGAEPATVRM
jgi:hypothetical protein